MASRFIRWVPVYAAFAAGPAQAELPTYTIAARDGQLMPPVLEVQTGQRFKIVIRNEGRDAIEFESLRLRKEKVIAPGAQSFVVIAPLKPGEYDYFDEFHSDTAKGRIVVK